MNKKDTIALLEKFQGKINALIEETKKECADDVVNVADSNTVDAAVKEIINASDFAYDIVNIVNNSVAEIMDAIPTFEEETKNFIVNEQRTSIESMKEIVKTYVVGTKDTIKSKESELFDSVLTYRENIGFIYEIVYCGGVCPLEEKIAESEQFYRETCEKYLDDKQIRKMLESLSDSIQKQKNNLINCFLPKDHNNKYRFSFSKGCNKKDFEKRTTSFLFGVTELDKKMKAVTDKIEEIKAAEKAAEEERKRKEEEARRQAEEEARKQREQAAKPHIDKIINGLARVKPSLDPYVNPLEKPSFCRFVGGENGAVYTKNLEYVSSENFATVPLYKLIEELVALSSPKGYDIIGLLRNNDVIAQDSKGIIVVDTGHRVSLDLVDTLLTNYVLCLNEKVIFTKNAGQKLKNLIQNKGE